MQNRSYNFSIATKKPQKYRFRFSTAYIWFIQILIHRAVFFANKIKLYYRIDTEKPQKDSVTENSHYVKL